MKRIFLILVSSLLLCNFVCTQNQEVQAAKYADTYAHSLSALQNSVETAHVKGLISDADYQAILKDLLVANNSGLDLNASIRAVSTGTSSVSEVNAIIALIENRLTDGTLHIKDPNTLAEVQVTVAAINLTLTSITQIYGGK